MAIVLLVSSIHAKKGTHSASKPTNTYTNMIKERKNTINGTVAEIVSINYETQQYSIKAAIQYLEGIIIPKLLLNAETWNNLKGYDYEELEKIQSQSIKRMLHLPYTTPTRGLYHELGIMTVNNRIKMRRCMFIQKLLKKKEQSLAKQIMLEQENMPGPNWLVNTKETLINIGITETIEEITTMKKSKWKKRVYEKIWKRENDEFMEWGGNSKKCKHMKNTKVNIQEYIAQLKPELAMAILQIRVGVLDVKENYHAKHEDKKCRNCDNEDETAEHFIKCLAKMNNTEIEFENIWSLTDNNKLDRVAQQVYKILKNNKIFEYRG